MVVARETIELAFVAAIQLLPPRQRAVLILRDVLGWSAKDTASLLSASVAAVNSALQRARATLRDHLGERRTDWAPASQPSEDERELLRRYVEAHERADADALAELLREDVRLTMPPHPTWYDGREAVMVATRQGFDPAFGELGTVVANANRQPAVAHYLRAPGDSRHRALALDLLRLEGGHVAEITSFVSPELFPPSASRRSSPSDEFSGELRLKSSKAITQGKGDPMRKLVVNTFMSLDGVMQSPGGPEEDPTGGFAYGGWGANYFDDEMMGRVSESGPYELLLGRGTYEIFAAHWPTTRARSPISSTAPASTSPRGRWTAWTGTTPP